MQRLWHPFELSFLIVIIIIPCIRELWGFLTLKSGKSQIGITNFKVMS